MPVGTFIKSSEVKQRNVGTYAIKNKTILRNGFKIHVTQIKYLWLHFIIDTINTKKQFHLTI